MGADMADVNNDGKADIFNRYATWIRRTFEKHHEFWELWFISSKNKSRFFNQYAKHLTD
jgi:hypothetical protein